MITDRKTDIIINALAIVVITPMALASSFFILNILFRTATNTNPFDEVSNEVLLAILSSLVIFAGLLSWIFKEIVKRNLEEEVQKLAEAERDVSKAEVFLGGSYIFNELSNFVKDVKSSCEECKNKENGELCKLHKKLKRHSYTSEALRFSEKAFKKACKLDDKEKYADIIIKIKENMAYFLATEWKEKLDNKEMLDEFNKARAIRIKNELCELIESGELSRYGDTITDEDINEIKETCIWVMYCFGNEEEKNKAKATIKKLKNTFSLEHFEILKERYNIKD